MQAARIFLVEDEAIIAQDLNQCLKRMGYEVPFISASGSETLEKLKTMKPDLVLMDIVLRGKPDGVETAREILERYQIPVVFLTAYGDESTFERAKTSEPSGYLLKPVEEIELKKAIEFALTKKAFDEKREGAEKARQRTLSLLMAVLEASSDGILVLNEKGEALQWNQKFLEMWGISPSVFYSGNFLTFDLLVERIQSPGVFLKHMEDLKYALKKEYRNVLSLKDGRSFEISVKSQVWGESESCLILTFRDVTGNS
jgi:PAS domain S-box-containing protein